MWVATDPVAQRAIFVGEVFGAPPDHTVGEFSYSNFDYIAVGAALEARTGKSWEELMRARIFGPLGMTSCGFGPPPPPNALGHEGEAGSYHPMDPSQPGADNPATLGPAGTVHCTLADWGKFGLDHLAAAHGGGKLLKPASYQWLHTPPAEGNYAGGWIVASDPRFGGAFIAHDGSNTLWYASIVIALDAGRVYLVTANAADDAAQKAVIETMVALPTASLTGK
jgi:D-alanyl-D-alanine carboxypeptidase